MRRSLHLSAEEVMAAGAIPVIVAEDYARPAAERVAWHECSFLFPPGRERDIVPRLRAVSDADALAMQAAGRRAFARIWGDAVLDERGAHEEFLWAHRAAVATLRDRATYTPP